MSQRKRVPVDPAEWQAGFESWLLIPPVDTDPVAQAGEPAPVSTEQETDGHDD